MNVREIPRTQKHVDKGDVQRDHEQSRLSMPVSTQAKSLSREPRVRTALAHWGGGLSDLDVEFRHVLALGVLLEA